MKVCRMFVFAVLMSGCATTPVAPTAVPADGPRVVTSKADAPWWRGAVFYEVFVRSYQDTNEDGIGDLKGLTDRLDYLNDGDPKTHGDLGVDALWLMPIFGSPSYHGYDTTDYEHVNPAYGTDADLDRLIAEAHKRGVKVVVDLVLNHTSNEHPWFVESARSPASPKRDWYVWSKTDPGWGQPWNEHGKSWHKQGDEYFYGLFWAGMPDLNWKNPAVKAELFRVASAWVKKGIDGFRLDAIRHLVETGPGKGQAGSAENHVILKELAATLKAINPKVAMVGEVWSTTDDIATYFGQGDELDMNFDFPLAGALVNSAAAGDATHLVELLQEVQKAYPPSAVDAPFLTNHDQQRVASALRDDRAQLGLAAALLLTLPGAPFIYYGEELGLPNGPGNADEWKRTPMRWNGTINAGFSGHVPWHESSPEQAATPPVSAQVQDPTSLLARYRSLVLARHASPALLRGDLQVLEAGTSRVLAFTRREGDEQVLVVHNLSPSPQLVTLKVPGSSAEPLFVDLGATATRTGDAWAVSVPARGSAVYRMR